MKRTITWLAICLALACLGLARLAVAAPASSNAEPLTGTWQCMSHGGSQGNMAFTLDLQQTGENVSGSVSSPLGDTDLTSATFKGDTLQIEIDGEDTQYHLTAKYANGKLSGTWSTSSGGRGTWEGKKAGKS